MPDRRPHDGPVARVWAAVVGELLRGKPPRVPLDRQNRVHAVERHDLGIVDAPKVRIRDVDATASVGRDLVPLPPVGESCGMNMSTRVLRAKTSPRK